MKKRTFTRVLACSLTAALLACCTGCSAGIAALRGAARAANSSKAELSAAVSSPSIQGSTAASVLVGTGNVSIRAGSGGGAAVKADCRVTKAAEPTAKTILAQAVLAVFPRNGTLVITVNDRSGGSIWDWVKKNYPKAQFEADLDITLPAAVSSFSVQDGVGDVALTGLSGPVNIEDGVGDVALHSPVLSGESTISAGVGDVTLAFTSKQKTGSLRAESGVGDIRVTASGVSVRSAGKAGGFTGGTAGAAVDGGLQMTFTAGVGSIKLP